MKKIILTWKNFALPLTAAFSFIFISWTSAFCIKAFPISQMAFCKVTNIWMQSEFEVKKKYFYRGKNDKHDSVWDNWDKVQVICNEIELIDPKFDNWFTHFVQEIVPVAFWLAKLVNLMKISRQILVSLKKQRVSFMKNRLYLIQKWN